MNRHRASIPPIIIKHFALKSDPYYYYTFSSKYIMYLTIFSQICF